MLHVSRKATVGGLAALVAAAVLVAGANLWADAPKDPAPKDQPKKEDVKKDDAKKIDPDIQKQLDQLRKDLQELRQTLEQSRRGFPGAFSGSFVPAEMAGRFRPQGRLGVLVEKPSGALADQLDLQKDHGLVIHDVVPDSAAAKAGLKNHDIIVEWNGKPVSSDVREFAKMVDEVKASTPVDVVVMRKGKKETVKGVALPEAAPESTRGFPGRRPAGNQPDGAPNPSR
jgi:C-terminal processing protease CtpA/Prc